MTNADLLEFLVLKCPGRSELELAKALFGERGTQQMVNQDIVLLVAQEKVQRKGQGGQTAPYRVFPFTAPHCE